VTCPRCQASSREGARFCEQCGARLARACASCGAEVAAEARFCGGCARPDRGRSGGGEPLRRSAELHPEAPRRQDPHHALQLEGERKLVTVLFADVKARWSSWPTAIRKRRDGFSTPSSSG